MALSFPKLSTQVAQATIIYHPNSLPTFSRAVDQLRYMLRNQNKGERVVGYYPMEDGSCLQIILQMVELDLIEENIRVIKNVKVSLEIEE